MVPPSGAPLRPDRARPLNRPRRLAVREAPGEAPLAVLRRAGWVRVAAILDCWRVDDEWWRRPIGRVYYRLLLEGGEQIEVFRDLQRGRWYRQSG